MNFYDSLIREYSEKQSKTEENVNESPDNYMEAAERYIAGKDNQSQFDDKRIKNIYKNHSNLLQL